MAPRVRPKKRGNLRIDAALDAMSPFGFSSKLVRNTVKELLSVYGGDDGWIFIEEGSYALLIDTILEKLKDGAIEKVHEENGRAEDHEETSVAGSSSGINETSSSNPEAEVTTVKLISSYVDNEFFGTTLSTNDSGAEVTTVLKQRDNVLISSYVDNEAFGTTLSTNNSEERCWKDDKVSGGDDCFRSTVNQSSRAHTTTINRRKPYHGWISSNDKEDLVYLTPAPLPEEFAKLLRPHAERKRKKRWDVKPAEL